MCEYNIIGSLQHTVIKFHVLSHTIIIYNLNILIVIIIIIVLSYNVMSAARRHGDK